MRVGRPVAPLPQPVCDYCGAKAVFVRPDEDGYPYRDDHGPLWVCTPCEAWIGIFPRSTRRVPLGRLANAELRDAKARLHAALEPMVQGKLRRDGGNVFEARSKGYRWLAGELNIPEDQCTIHQLNADQCKAAVDVIERFAANRRSGETE